MREGAKYVNHLGRSVDLNGDGAYLSSGELSDWSIGYAILNGRIASFFREPREIPAVAAIICDTGAEGLAKRDEIYEAAAVDVEAAKPGRLYVGDWYMSGFVVGSRKDRYWYSGAAADYELTFASDDPRWTLEHSLSFAPGSNRDGGLTYPRDYPHSYGTTMGSVALENPSFLPSAAKIVVYGPAANPYVIVAGNRYEVEVSVPDGGHLVIDGAARTPTITLVHGDGTAENVFHRRRGTQKKGGGSYVFEPVPPGVSSVMWDGSFGFDLVIHEKRDERRWSGWSG